MRLARVKLAYVVRTTEDSVCVRYFVPSHVQQFASVRVFVVRACNNKTARRSRTEGTRDIRDREIKLRRGSCGFFLSAYTQSQVYARRSVCTVRDIDRATDIILRIVSNFLSLNREVTY